MNWEALKFRAVCGEFEAVVFDAREAYDGEAWRWRVNAMGRDDEAHGSAASEAEAKAACEKALLELARHLDAKARDAAVRAQRALEIVRSST